MSTIEYSLMDPTGNVTLLVETPVERASRPSVAARLMEAEPSAEQVGFLTVDGDKLSLRMAGGEFCGNAAMCAAAWFAGRQGAGDAGVHLRVSGAAEPVAVEVSAAAGGVRRGRVSMPRVRAMGTHAFSDGRALCVVRFDGISHVILREAPDHAGAERLARAWCSELGADALGLMFRDVDAGRLTPLVYVPAAGTLVWERSCASGTAAVGAYLAAERGGRVDLALRQPGGTLEIEARPDGSLFLSGTVRTVARRVIEIETARP